MEKVSELRPLLTEMRANREMVTGDSGSGGGACRSSINLGGTSSSGGRGSGHNSNKGSNSGSKKRAGWEDADVEFYREAYHAMPPSDGNSHTQHLATLLPSTRLNTISRNTIQKRNKRSTKRRKGQATSGTHIPGVAGANATWVRTGRRGSDTCLEVLPDLTQGADEEQTWLELQEIKSQPVSLTEKKKLKRQLLAAPTLRTKGWQSLQLSGKKVTKKWSRSVKERLSHLELWHSKLRYVEGNFGTGLVALFSFIKWLLFLNLFMSLLIVIFIVLPQFLFVREPVDEQYVWSNSTEIEGCCHDKYMWQVQKGINETYSLSIESQILQYVMQGLKGTAVVELSPIFYGFYEKCSLYTPQISYLGTFTMPYQLPLAYLFVMLALAALSLVLMVRKAAKGLRENLRSTEGEFYQFCNLIFGGWDFCIENKKASVVKHRAIFNEFCRHIDNEKYKEEKELRSRRDKFCLLFMRLIMNVLVIAILCGSFALIFYVTNMSFQQLVTKKAGQVIVPSPLKSSVQTFNSSFLMNDGASKVISINDEIDSSGDYYYEAYYAGDYTDVHENTSEENLLSESATTEASERSVHVTTTTTETVPRTTKTRKKNNKPVLRILTTRSVPSEDESKNVLQGNDKTVNDGDEKNESTSFIGFQAEEIWKLFYEYFPSVTILALNIIVPVIFNFLVQFEHYSTTWVLRITLFRTVSLRLLSLGVLLFTLHKDTSELNDRCTDSTCNGTVLCWETYVGQQIYKLALLDLIVIFSNTFLVNFPRKILGQHIMKRTALGQKLGAMEFEIPKHVLDIVYGQTLCWLGMFYAPLLPAITSAKLILVFYIKYFDCSVNCHQSSQFYRTSRSNSLFISILLISFIVTLIPVGYTIVELEPSSGCGPFRNLPSIWSTMINLIAELPHWAQSCVFFIGTAGFAVPTIVILSLLGYYYYAVGAANKHLVMMLKGQLVLEGHDKQFLLNRLDQMIQRVSEDRKKTNRSHYSADSQTASGSNDMTLQM